MAGRRDVRRGFKRGGDKTGDNGVAVHVRRDTTQSCDRQDSRWSVASIDTVNETNSRLQPPMGGEDNSHGN